MRFTSARIHLSSICIACFLVFFVRIQDRKWDWLTHVQTPQSVVFTPYFPGLNLLGHHEIFSETNKKFKKIVFLGASAVHSVGCDSTWLPSTQAIRQPSNVHHSCSVPAQLNFELASNGFPNWRVFNLAKAGGRLVPMVYVHAKLLELKPDIVIYGDNYPYYMETNAGADNLTPKDYAFLKRIYSQSYDTKKTWETWYEHLQTNGLHTEGYRSPRSLGKDFMRLQDPGSFSGAIAYALISKRKSNTELNEPLPIRLTTFRQWKPVEKPQTEFFQFDTELKYAQGFKLIAQTQKMHGGLFFLYHSPQYDHRDDPVYLAGLKKIYGDFALKNAIGYSSLVDLPLTPISQTYDGHHQTIDGNRQIAKALFKQLLDRGMLQ